MRIYIYLLITISFISCSNNDNTTTTPILGIDEVQIGSQIWQKKNLDVTTYRDGTPIPQVTNPSEWYNLTTGAWCYYNNDPAFGEIYGKIYNWYAVAGIHDDASLTNTSLRKQLAPQGWHVFSNNEWNTLINFLGGEEIAGGKMKETGTVFWQMPNAEASNSSGFTGLPGGRRPNTGTFRDEGSNGFWWTSTDYDSEHAYMRYLFYNSGSGAGRFGSTKSNGCSVRCIKD